MCRGFLLYINLGGFARDFLGRFFLAFLPRKNPAREVREGIRRPKNTNPPKNPFCRKPDHNIEFLGRVRIRILRKDLREAKPGCFQTGCFPLFSGKVQIVSRTLSGLFLVGALNRLRKRKRTNRENPRTIPAQIGKIPGKVPKGQKRTKKEGQVQIGKPPRLKHPRLAALERFEARQNSYSQKKLDVHDISARNSGAGNGRADFMGAWHFGFFCRKTPMPIKFLLLGGGVGFF